jgi:hypothetical protein
MQLRHLWYRQVRYGVSSRTQAQRLSPCQGPPHSIQQPTQLLGKYGKYYIFGRCGVNSRTQVPMFRDYLHAWVHPLALEHQSLEAHRLPPGRVITKIHVREI